MMEVSISLTLGLQVVLLLSACAGKLKHSDRCDYIQISDWSACDPWTLSSTRSLELVSGNIGMCDKNRLERRDCGKEVAGGDGGNDVSSRQKFNKKKKLKRKKKKSNLPDCKYKRSKWSSCDVHERTESLVQTLQSGSAAECQPVIVLTRPCVAELEMVEAVEEKAEGVPRRDRKNGRERRRKQKNKNQFQMRRNKKKGATKNSSDLPLKPPPPPSELSVEPHTTSAVVSWHPPQDDAGVHMPVGSYKIGYGQGFPDLETLQVDGQEVMYIIQNLEPGREYIVSLRAKTRSGVSQPLYETIRTHMVGEESEQTIQPPVGIRAIVLSAEAINVTWVDPSKNIETTSRKKDYYVKYQQLSHAPVSGSLQQIQHTPNTHVLVSGLQPFTKYEFAVLASDGERNSSWSAATWNITQQAAPSGAPGDLTIIQDPGNPRQLIVSWQPPAQANGALTGYHVSYSSILPDGQSTVETKDVLGNLLSLTLTDLVPGQTYNFSVRAVNNQGMGPRLTIRNYHFPEELPPQSSPAATVTSPDQSAPDDSNSKQHREGQLAVSIPRPENLHVSIMSPNSALVSWQEPHLGKWKTRPTSLVFTLRYRDLTRKSSEYMFASPTLTSIFMVDLEPATKYEFSVRTDSGDQHSDWTEPVTNTTFDSAPSTSPSHVTITQDDGDATTAFLKWQPPEVPNGNITGYIVFYETVADRRSATVPAGELSFRIPFLKPHTKYFFRIGAWNSQGFSPLSNRVVYRTPRVVGSPPADVTVSPASDDRYNAVVSWQPPSSSKRKIKFYTVTRYTEDGQQRAVLKVPAYTLTTLAKKLLPSTVYQFTVQAHYQRDSGPHSAAVQYSIPKELL